MKNELRREIERLEFELYCARNQRDAAFWVAVVLIFVCAYLIFRQ